MFCRVELAIFLVRFLKVLWKISTLVSTGKFEMLKVAARFCKPMFHSIEALTTTKRPICKYFYKYIGEWEHLDKASWHPDATRIFLQAPHGHGYHANNALLSIAAVTVGQATLLPQSSELPLGVVLLCASVGQYCRQKEHKYRVRHPKGNERHGVGRYRVGCCVDNKTETTHTINLSTSSPGSSSSCINSVALGRSCVLFRCLTFLCTLLTHIDRMYHLHRLHTCIHCLGMLPMYTSSIRCLNIAHVHCI